VTVVDLVVIAFVLSSVAHGLRVGAAIQVASFAGLWGGLAVGAAIAPKLSTLVTTPGARVIVALVALFGSVSLLSALFRFGAVRLLSSLRNRRLLQADFGIGAVVGGVSMLLVTWLIASMLSNVPLPALTQQLQRSAILRAMDNVMPPAPSVFSRIQRVLDPSGFPNVFAQFEPPPASPLPAPSNPAVRAAAARARASTVKILDTACGELIEGSGFAISSDTVVTNAHVVAGSSSQAVEDQGGSHRAYAVAFDPKLDVAVLHVSRLDAPPLRVTGAVVPRGTDGAVLGYPGDGPFSVAAAVVLREQTAVGRDIYGNGLTTRDIYELQADVREGNSGGPLVDTRGVVVGVVFARSARTQGIGYALTTPPVLQRVDQAGNAQVSTGPCAAG
jgi:S1-C subfamily serine protease